VNRRYLNRFNELRRRDEGAFVPFTVLGDPDLESSLAILRAFAEGGADMLELGLAFSDPIADGPTIQGADLRALRAGASPAAALQVLAAFRAEHPAMPVGLLVYANLVHRPGPDIFYRRAAAAGADSALVADLPLEESTAYARAARRSGVAPVYMATPLTPDDRLARILKAGGPYLYVVSRSGVTGRDKSLAAGAAPLLARIRRLGDTPTLLGFGIGRPEHVRQALGAGADGAISGSAAVEIIARYVASGRALGKGARARLAGEMRDFVRAMKAATRR
jgi:tryptophan synthase alpha chain